MSEEHLPAPDSGSAGICSRPVPELSATAGLVQSPPKPQHRGAPGDRQVQPRAGMQQSWRGHRLTAHHIFLRDREGTTAARCWSDASQSVIAQGSAEAASRQGTGSACPENRQHPRLQLPTRRPRQPPAQPRAAKGSSAGRRTRSPPSNQAGQRGARSCRSGGLHEVQERQRRAPSPEQSCPEPARRGWGRGMSQQHVPKPGQTPRHQAHRSLPGCGSLRLVL